MKKRSLRDLIIHPEEGSESWNITLKEANIPLNRSLEETHLEFEPYRKDEEQIIQSLFDKNIVKINIKETDIHHSLDVNERSNRKELMKDIGLGEKIKFIESDLSQNLDDSFDVVIFSPPYLPGDEGLGDEEIWRGGKIGAEVTENFLQQVSTFLRPEGFALVVVSSLSELGDLKNKYNLQSVNEKSLCFENLELLKFDKYRIDFLSKGIQ